MTSSTCTVILAPDSFKECLSAPQVCTAMGRGILDAEPDIVVIPVPMADGGEGSADIIQAAAGGRRVDCVVTGPLGDPVDAGFVCIDSTHTAFIEAASACGLEQVPVPRRDPLVTTTRGVGELVRAAIDTDARQIIIGVGGSATVDGGAGMAAALGFRFLNAEGQALADGGGALTDLCRIAPPTACPVHGAVIKIAADVTNPLLGPRGAARTFGPQKGADSETVERLEQGLATLDERIRQDLGIHIAETAGAGAAGGLAAGLIAFLGAEVIAGVDMIIELTGLEEKIRTADLVITGEGRTDSQSLEGKVCSGVAKVARKHGVRCVILSGTVDLSDKDLSSLGVAEAVAICRGPDDLAAAMEDAEQRLEAAAARIVKQSFGTG